MAKRDQWRGPVRRVPRQLQPRPRILIMCEGEKTEPVYFRYWKQETRNNMVSIEIVGVGAAPITLVQRAAARKRASEDAARRSGDSFEKLDEVWCVFDRDDHLRWRDAIRQAQANGIHLAFSNPSFELWLLLHCQDQRAHAEREVVQRRFKRYFPRYGKEPPCADLRPLYAEALRRARELDRWQTSRECKGLNPWTGVHVLTERLIRLDRDELLRRHHS
jgi:hypothetical protein